MDGNGWEWMGMDGDGMFFGFLKKTMFGDVGLFDDIWSYLMILDVEMEYLPQFKGRYRRENDEPGNPWISIH